VVLQYQQAELRPVGWSLYSGCSPKTRFLRKSQSSLCPLRTSLQANATTYATLCQIVGSRSSLVNCDSKRGMCR
jgi:hypothetical protein